MNRPAETVSTFAMTFLILIEATVFCAFLSVTQLLSRLAAAISGMDVPLSGFFCL